MIELSWCSINHLLFPLTLQVSETSISSGGLKNQFARREKEGGQRPVVISNQCASIKVSLWLLYFSEIGGEWTDVQKWWQVELEIGSFLICIVRNWIKPIQNISTNRIIFIVFENNSKSLILQHCERSEHLLKKRDWKGFQCLTVRLETFLRLV